MCSGNGFYITRTHKSDFEDNYGLPHNRCGFFVEELDVNHSSEWAKETLFWYARRIVAAHAAIARGIQELIVLVVLAEQGEFEVFDNSTQESLDIFEGAMTRHGESASS